MNLTQDIRRVLKAAGAPLTLDQLMEQLPEDTDRHTVGARLRGLKKAGELGASIEDGKVAYTWKRDPERANRAATLTDRIRTLLRDASKPMTTADVCAELPGENADTVSALLNQRKRAGEFDAVPAGGRTLAYALSGHGNVSVAVSVGNVSTVAPAPSKPAKASPPTPPASPIGEALDTAVRMAEAARDSYVESLVDHNIYGWLTESVAAAQRARQAWVADQSS